MLLNQSSLPEYPTQPEPEILTVCDCCNSARPENEVHLFTAIYGGWNVCLYCLAEEKRHAVENESAEYVAEIIAYEKTL